MGGPSTPLNPLYRPPVYRSAVALSRLVEVVACSSNAADTEINIVIALLYVTGVAGRVVLWSWDVFIK